MISANVGLALLLGLAASGSHDHKKPRSATCNDCGVESAPVLREVQVLRGSRKKDDREDAAEDLRKLDWRCHPEAVLALADALTFDRSDDVREEAAESLGKMGACVPAAHEALSRAAAADPDGGVRKEARKALAALGRRCIVDCRACGPIPTGPAIPGPTAIPDDWLPILAPSPNPTTSTAPPPAAGPQLEPIPRAIPDPLEIPPPPPTPYQPQGPVGSRTPPTIRSTSRTR